MSRLFAIIVDNVGKDKEKNGMQNITFGERNSIIGPEEIGSGVDDVFGRDFFDDCFVFFVVVGNRGAAQQGKKGSGPLA